MANVKITALTNLSGTDAEARDVFVIDDISATETKKITIQNVSVFTGNAHLVQANVTAEDAALQARLTTNVTALTNEDTALQARLTTNVTTFSNEDTALQSRLSTNVTSLSNEDTALQARLTSNVNSLTTNINTLDANADAIETRRVANVTIHNDEDTALQARITANAARSASNDFITFTRLNANINVVQDNVASVTVGTAADTETRLNANLNVVQDNVAAVEARRVANTTAFTNEDTALQSRLTTNVTALTNEDTALQARLTTNVTTFTNEDTALQARITANNTLLHSNDFITFTRLNANVDVVQDNVASIISGATAFTGDVTLTNTDDGSSAGPVIVLDRQSASPADSDYLGRVQFKGKDDGGSNETYSQISGKIIDASAGSEDGAVEVAVKKAGSQTIVARFKNDKLLLLNGTDLSVDGDSEFTGQVSMSDDLIVTGNLTVNGDTTTVNSENKVIQDRFIMLANSVSGAPSADVGILFNRGTSGNAAFFYDESAKFFTLSETRDPDTNVAISPTGAANLSVGQLTASTVAFNGADLNTAITDNVATLNTADTALQSRLTTNVTALTNEDTALQARITANSTTAASNDFVTFTRLNANINTVSSNAAAVETRRVANIAGAVSTITTADLTASRALVSGSGGKIEVSAITSTELAFLDGIDQNINSNLQALAAGIAASGGVFPTGDYGLLDAANAATDAFGFAVADLTIFDMSTTPSGELSTQDLGAFT